MITFQVGVDTAKVRVSRSAKEEKVVKENEATEENIVVVDEKETTPVLKPSLKADESDAVNAIQVAEKKTFFPSHQIWLLFLQGWAQEGSDWRSEESWRNWGKIGDVVLNAFIYLLYQVMENA